MNDKLTPTKNDIVINSKKGISRTHNNVSP